MKKFIEIDKIRKICIFELGLIGDSVVIIPAMRALRKSFPDAHIVRIVNTSVRDLFDGCPFLDEIIEYDKNGKERSIWGKFKFLHKIRKKECDMFINFHTPEVGRNFGIYFRDNFFSFLTGAKVRVGYCSKGNGFFLTHKIFANSVSSEYIVDVILRLLGLLKIYNPSRKYEIWTTEENERSIDKTLKGKKLKRKFNIGLHPCSKYSAKSWKERNFAELSDILAKRYRANIIFTGARKDNSIIEEIVSYMRENAISFAGKISIGEFVALCKNLSLFVCVDTGPMHLAVAAGIPTIALFSGRDRKGEWEPREDNFFVVRKDVDCSPCFKEFCDHHLCMETITVKDVLDVIKGVVS